MLQAHQGYFQADGRIILNNSLVQLPINKKVTILWEEDPIEIDSKWDNEEFKVAFEETRRKRNLQRLRGSCKDPTMVEPPEIPLEHELLRRYELI